MNFYTACSLAYDVLLSKGLVDGLAFPIPDVEPEPISLEENETIFPAEFTDRQSTPLSADQERLERFTSFTSPEKDSFKLLHGITENLKSNKLLEIIEKREDWFKIRAAYDCGNNNIGTLVAILYKTPTDHHIVEFKRTSGDTIYFITVCNSVFPILKLNGLIDGLAFPIPVVEPVIIDKKIPLLFPVETTKEHPEPLPAEQSHVDELKSKKPVSFYIPEPNCEILMSYITDAFKGLTVEGGPTLAEFRERWCKIYAAYTDNDGVIGTLYVSVYTHNGGHIVKFNQISGQVIPFDCVYWSVRQIIMNKYVVGDLASSVPVVDSVYLIPTDKSPQHVEDITETVDEEFGEICLSDICRPPKDSSHDDHLWR
jgi:hypothetical protein